MRTIVSLAAVLLLSLCGAATASAQVDLSGSGSYLVFRLVQDDSYVPTQIEIERDWTQCRHGGWLKLHPRTLTGFEVATAETLDHRGSFSEKNEKWRLKVNYHLTGWHTRGDSWEGRYETTIRVFYKGHRVDTCMRRADKAVWYAGIL